MFDSVFTQFAQPFIPFESDRPILPEKRITGDLDLIETAASTQLQRLLYAEAQKVIAGLKGAIARGDTGAIVDAKWNALPKMQRSLWALWTSGWGLGRTHAGEEIGILTENVYSRKRKFNAANVIALFAKKDESVRYRESLGGGSFRPPTLVSIRNTQAETAIRDRINRLSQDVTSQEFQRIKQHILAAATPQADTGEPIDRRELEKRINNDLGEKASRFKGRAETIARTELAFAYNTGRLQTYKDSGLVESLIFYAIRDERVCPICSSRNGLVIPLSDAQAIAANFVPCHPKCRCTISPVLSNPKGRRLQQDPNRQIQNRQLVPAPAKWMTAAILAAVLLGRSARIANTVTGRVVGVAAATVAVDQGIGAIAAATGEASPALVQSTSPPAIIEGQTQQSALPPPAGVVKLAVPDIVANGINLNTATAEQLRQLLPPRQLTNRQIQSIITYRETNPLQTIDDFKRVPGLGEKTYGRLKGIYERDVAVSVFINDVRDPVQLWATNLGLTRSQARSIFEELQRGGAFSSIDDFQRRMQGKGVGAQTVKQMQERANLIQARIQQPLKQPVIQPVGSGGSPQSSAQGNVSTPPSPSRNPAPYISSGAVASERAERPIAQSRRDAINQLTQDRSTLSDTINALDAKAQSTVDRQLQSRPQGSRQTPAQVLQNEQSAVGKIRTNHTQAANTGNAQSTQLSSLEQRIERMEARYQNLLDPTAPNYFERTPQAIAKARAELKQVREELAASVKQQSSQMQELEKRRNNLQNSLKASASQPALKELDSQSQALRRQLNDWNRRIQELEQIEVKQAQSVGRSQSLTELQRLKQEYVVLQERARTTEERLRSAFQPAIDATEELSDQIRSLQNQQRINANRLNQLEQRLNTLPTVRSQLDPITRQKYDSVKDLRTVQRRFAEGTSQFRQTDNLAQRNLREINDSNLDDFNRYDDQFRRYEADTSPVIERQLTRITQDLQELQSMPPGSVSWLLDFNGWELVGLTDDLALAIQGLPEPQAIVQLRALAANVQQKIGNIQGSVNSIKQQTAFRYVDSTEKIVAQDALVGQAENQLRGWSVTRDRFLSRQNIGSSNNRLTELWREIRKARAANDTARLQQLYTQVSPDDSFGYARRTLLDLEEWDQRYRGILASEAKPGAIAKGSAPATGLEQQFQGARENFLQELGESRLRQSQAIEQGYEDAKDIYERIRSDASKVPTFDVGGRARTAADILEETAVVEKQIDKLRSLQQMSDESLVATANPANLPRIRELSKERDALNEQFASSKQRTEGLRASLTEAREQGKGTKRVTQQLATSEGELKALSDQVKAVSEEIRDLRLPDEVLQQVRSRSLQSAQLSANIKRSQSELAVVNVDLSNLQQQQQRLGGGLSQRAARLQADIDQLALQRRVLIQRLAADSGRLQQARAALNELRLQG